MIVAVTMLKDEADIIAPVLTQLYAQGVDLVIAADNMSSDDTRPILESFAARHPLTIVEDNEPGYYQAAKITRLARLAAEAGATWVLPFDADEWFYGVGGTIKQVLDACPADVVKAYGFDHVPQPSDNRGDPDPVTRLQWRRATTQTFPKVAFRPHPDVYVHMGNHNVDRPGAVAHDIIEYRHFGYRSPEQMARKVRQGKAAYEASTVHEMHGAHWRRMGAMTDLELAVEWEALLCEEGLIHDPAPNTASRAARPPGAPVSVVIPHYGSAGLTAACLLAVAENSPAGVEVIVVDNGTGERFTCDRMIVNPSNLGFAAACNQGARAATNDTVVFLNNDTVPTPGWLPPLMAALGEPGVEMAGSLLLYPDSRVQHAGVSITREDGILVGRNERENLRRRDVDGVTGACMAVDRDRFIEAGGFDEGYWNGYEDVDLCLTFRARGWRILFEPSSVVIHHESQGGPARWARVRQNIDRLQAKWSEAVTCG